MTSKREHNGAVHMAEVLSAEEQAEVLAKGYALVPELAGYAIVPFLEGMMDRELYLDTIERFWHDHAGPIHYFCVLVGFILHGQGLTQAEVDVYLDRHKKADALFWADYAKTRKP